MTLVDTGPLVAEFIERDGLTVWHLNKMTLTRSFALMRPYFGGGSVSIVTTVAVGVLVGGLAWCAAYIPARRASQVDPAVVLRAE